MNFISLLKTAFNSLRAHKVRSALTVLGLMIGVTSIILVLNMGEGIKNYVLGTLDVFGADLIEVEIKVPNTSQASSENAMGMASGVSITTLKMEDAEAVAKHPNVRGMYAGLMGQQVVSFEDEHNTSLIWGMTASFFDLYNAKVVEGRPYLEEEDRAQARVAVIGPKLSEKFFAGGEAIGQYIKIGNKKFRVIGVMEEQGTYMGMMDMDSVVYMPARTLQKQVMGVDYIQYIMMFPKDKTQSAATAADIIDIMRSQHEITDPNKDDFAVTTAEEAMKMMNTVTGGITLLLMAIAGISLIVGGVGIMNIMYVSVSERTYEIGLRKAIGATSGNILWQFMWEAIFLTFMGGVVGVVFGTLLSFISALAAKSFGIDWGFNFSVPGLFLAVGFSVAVGLIFGVRPARHAASLEPVEAMRME
ncbi:MAG: ABC transporter permease [Patescibacteria group bacterium]|nr:ABC transporter permease [Patescibacteria group bacterium]